MKLAKLVIVLLLSGSQVSALELTLSDSVSKPQAVTLIYDPSDGTLSANGGGELMVALEIRSSSALFDIPPDCERLFTGFELRLDCGNEPPVPFSAGEFFTGTKFFALKTDGFETINFGQSLPSRLTGDELLSDLHVDGVFMQGRGFKHWVKDSPFLHIVPEPSTAVLLVLAATLTVSKTRRKRI